MVVSWLVQRSALAAHPPPRMPLPSYSDVAGCVNPLGMAHCVPFYDDRALAGQTTTVDKGAMQSGANKNYANEFGGMTTKAQVHLRANHSPLPVANSSPVVTTQGGAPERRV